MINSGDTTSSARPGKTRVMLVDDSAVIRGLIARILESDTDIQVVSSVSNGQMAVQSIRRIAPDIVILDIEMPVMDGLTALPLILKEHPRARVIMCSTLSKKGASVSLQALSLGAADCIVKPTSGAEIGSAPDFRQTLLRIIKGFTAYRERRALPPLPAARRPDTPLRIVAIGSSTGGPQALFTVMKNFRDCRVPIVITQHMPATFTAVLAEHIYKNCAIPCAEAREDMPLLPGHAYVAPGGHHLALKNDQGRITTRIDHGPPENYCKPSVDPMLRSVVTQYGAGTLAVILTGMGSDGLAGCRAVVGAGGCVIAQDQATSVVWGMPGAVTEAGLCRAVLPLSEIGPWVLQALEKRHEG